MLFATTRGVVAMYVNYSAVLGCQFHKVKFHVLSKVSQIRWEGVLSALSTWFRVGDGHQSGQDRQDLESSSHTESLPYSRWREIYIQMKRQLCYKIACLMSLKGVKCASQHSELNRHQCRQRTLYKFMTASNYRRTQKYETRLTF